MKLRTRHEMLATPTSTLSCCLAASIAAFAPSSASAQHPSARAQALMNLASVERCLDEHPAMKRDLEPLRASWDARSREVLVSEQDRRDAPQAKAMIRKSLQDGNGNSTIAECRYLVRSFTTADEDPFPYESLLPELVAFHIGVEKACAAVMPDYGSRIQRRFGARWTRQLEAAKALEGSADFAALQSDATETKLRRGVAALKDECERRLL